MSEKHFRGGYYFPLDVRRALSFEHAPRYLRACVRRARLNPDSARNAQTRRALRAIERAGRVDLRRAA